MMTNAYNNGEEKGAAASGAAGSQAQAPKLRSGAHYAMWRPDMEVYLERHGANSVHTREMTAKDWQSLSEQVRQWDEEALTAALLLVTKGSSAAAASTGSNTFSGQLPDDQTAARKLVREMVERSKRVYGVLYAALPEKLRKQAESIPRGFAFGLWQWLEQKFHHC